ncbi:sulfiredoxin [Pyrus ussuriensis x Pyrus communis]|uniref:sulfiredoxin n=1 Tax=Pyrus ussuriensis x Pyrus communis TaxID=2448454 RepID=A0A5N5IGW0_9ROSA|nr:sulfiredoxin [Pyrus ussuriensis x Pyrus communis]
MAHFVLQVPNSLRSFTISASLSSNGSTPLSSGGSSGGGGGPVILELPLDKIRRPLMRTRSNDPNKVQELMDSIQEIGLQVPIDVLDVDGVSLVVIATRLTSALGSPQYVAKLDVEQKKLSGITSADSRWAVCRSEFAAFTKLIRYGIDYLRRMAYGTWDSRELLGR